MSFLTNLEHSAESKLSDYGHLIGDDFQKAEHEVANAARVTEVLAKGAWDYTKEHPADVAKTIAIAAGVGIVTGALTPLLPAVAVVGVTAGLGAIGTAALGIKTYEAAKSAMLDLDIVWNADFHSKEDVAQAEKHVEEKTGQAVTNLALLPVTFIVGNAAGNLGTKALVSAASATEGTLAPLSISDSGSECALETSAASEPCVTTSNGDGWSKMMNNPVFNFFSSSYVAKSDLRTVAHSLNPSVAAHVEMTHKSA
ncbi:MAG TPA: hypothetical protein V6C76_04640 [Drouetiella sp.]